MEEQHTLCETAALVQDTDSPVQTIVPLGVLAEIGYCVHWEGTKFELTDPSGCILDTQLDSGCPLVDEPGWPYYEVRETQGTWPLGTSKSWRNSGRCSH